MRILLLGDTHGNFNHLKHTLVDNRDEYDVAIQLGDFGFLWNFNDATPVISELLETLDCDLYFLDGNHECFPMFPPRDADHPVEVNKRLFYLPRGYRWEWDDTKFLSLGGAVSIDKLHRKVGVSWFADETITDDDVARSVNGETVDIMLTHDAPDTPQLDAFLAKFSLADLFGRAGEQLETESAANRNRINTVVAAVKPKMVIHGHYHWRYRQDGNPTVIGLSQDDTEGSWMILDSNRY